jgi:hypothetical protein
LAGICGILLVFVMVFTGCPTGTQEVEGTVNAPSVEAAVVTATPVLGGVKLEWTPVIDVENYNIWRGTPETENRWIGSSNSNNAGFDEGANKYIYYDLKSDTNDLVAATEYTYTVVAVSASKTLTDSRAVVVATPETIPEKGTKVAAPTGVTLALDPETNSLTVSWTAGEGIPTGNYWVSFYLNGDYSPLKSYPTSGNPEFGYLNDSNVSYSLLSSTSRKYDWREANQFDGAYTVQVVANPPSDYYKSSDIGVSEKVSFESLFSTSSIWSGGSYFSNTAGDAIANFTGSVSFSSSSPGKPGVTYSVERAPADSVGNVTGDYAAVTLSDSNGDNLAAGDLKADVLGNLRYTTVYDKTLEDGKSYKYRVKATKGDKTQIKELSSFVTIDSRDFFNTSISIGNPVSGTGKVTYDVDITYVLKGALKAGDSLVLYYVKGSGSSAQSGPYEELVRFTRDELEKSGGVTPKSVIVPKATGDTSAFVRAYVEYEDGRPRTSFTNNLSGSVTVSGSGSNSYGTLTSYY